MNLLNEANNAIFVAIKCNIVKDQSNATDVVWNEIMYCIEVLKPKLCDFNDVYILVRGNVNVVAGLITQVAFKTCAQQQ